MHVSPLVHPSRMIRTVLYPAAARAEKSARAREWFERAAALEREAELPEEAAAELKKL